MRLFFLLEMDCKHLENNKITVFLSFEKKTIMNKSKNRIGWRVDWAVEVGKWSGI